MNLIDIVKYYNLALKSGSVIFGIDNIKKNKNISVVIVSKELAQNSYDKICLHCKKFNIKILFLENNDFIKLANNDNVKCIGVTNKDIANIMKKIWNGDYYDRKTS